MAKCQVGVVGTGVISTGTATLLICNRYPTVMYGRTQKSCERGLRAVGEALDDLISAGAMQKTQKATALSYLTTTTSYADLAGCAYCIESVAETIEAKREVMAHLEEVCSPETVLSATTVSDTHLERVDFLRYLQEAYRTHEPDQDIAGNRLLTYSVHLSLHVFLGNGKSRLTKQAGEGSNHQRKEQNFLEFFQSAPPYKESGLAIKEMCIRDSCCSVRE